MTDGGLQLEAPLRPADRYAVVPSPIGDLLLMGNGEQLLGLHLPGGDDPDGAPAAAGLAADPAAFGRVRAELDEYFAGDRQVFGIRLAPPGAGFNLRVWQELTAIGYGQTASYGQIADRIGIPGSARAVGTANHVNPIAIIIPCHRVIGADGSLTGYGGGLRTKEFLLALEAPTLF